MTKTKAQLIFHCFIFFILIILLNASFYGQNKTYTYSVKGTLLDYKWAHSQNKLAILYEDEVRYLVILDAAKKKMIKKRIDLKIILKKIVK